METFPMIYFCMKSIKSNAWFQRYLSILLSVFYLSIHKNLSHLLSVEILFQSKSIYWKRWKSVSWYTFFKKEHVLSVCLILLCTIKWLVYATVYLWSWVTRFTLEDEELSETFKRIKENFRLYITNLLKCKSILLIRN